jgi:probable rRNA maturation factor
LSQELYLRNRQHARAVDLRLLRKIAVTLLGDLLELKKFELGIHLVDSAEITRLNETYLGHAGATDVITFNYLSASSQAEKPAIRQVGNLRYVSGSQLHGEIFICLPEAVAQARRFDTSWQAEVVRYVVHGVLHLMGYDDSTQAARRKMKREEDRLVAELAGRFALSKLARKSKLGR